MNSMSQDMVIIHRVFRREFALLPGLVRAVPAGDTDRVARLAGHLQLLLDVVDHHHEGEDLLLLPRLRERAPEHVALFDGMDGDHRDLHDGLARLHGLVDAWRQTASVVDRDELADAVESIVTPLVEHMDQEEREVLPLVDQLLTPQEWGELGQRAFGALKPDDAMIVLAQMNEESPAEEWSAFVTHLPPPVQDAFVQHALPAYPGYTAAIRGS